MTNLNNVFWGEIAPSDHFLQIYETDEVFLDSLEAFASSGFVFGDGVVILATEAHLKALEERLRKSINLDKLIAGKQYIEIDAETALAEIMTDDNIEEARFEKLVNDLLGRVHKKEGSKVRVFGELVAILWGQGNRKATIKLEKLWNEICSTGALCLYCAYPKAGFRQDAVKSIQHICDHHNSIVENNTFCSELNIYGEKLSIPTV